MKAKDGPIVLFLMCILAPSSLIAMVAWWRHPRLWWACLVALVTAVGIVLYLPIRVAVCPPTDDFGGFGILAEFLICGHILFYIHVASLIALDLLMVEKRVGAENQPKSE